MSRHPKMKSGAAMVSFTGVSNLRSDFSFYNLTNLFTIKNLCCTGVKLRFQTTQHIFEFLENAKGNFNFPHRGRRNRNSNSNFEIDIIRRVMATYTLSRVSSTNGQ